MDPSPITSVDNPLVKRLVKLRRSSRARADAGEVLLVGRKLVAESGEIRLGLVTDDPIEGVECRVVTNHVMKKITGLEEPDGQAAVVPLPQFSRPVKAKRLLILDSVSDPGNMGTLFRTALALGWEGVVLVGDCADPFNDKALRAARGAPLRFPHWRMEWDELDAWLESVGCEKLIADVTGERAAASTGVALVLGNEGCGASKRAYEGGRAVTIEMAGEMESLNVAVAGGILMHELRAR